MNNEFDDLTRDFAQSPTRRGALTKFGVGLAGIALASLGLANKAAADPKGPKGFNCDCSDPAFAGCKSTRGGCFRFCVRFCSGG